ncbi:MAG: hypothetical protein R6W76_02425 [Caldilinea sp.]
MTVTSQVTVTLRCHLAPPSADVTAQEAAIDHLVYGLYGLTVEEIKIVEGE